MRVEAKVAAIAAGRRAATATAVRPQKAATPTSPEVPPHVTAKLRELMRRVPKAHRAGYARRMLTVWQAQSTGSVVTAAGAPDQVEARAGLALVIALDRAGAFDD